MVELVEMMEDDSLNMKADLMITEEKGDPIMMLGGRGRGEGDGLYMVECLGNHNDGKISVEEKGRSTAFEDGIIGTDAMEAKKL